MRNGLSIVIHKLQMGVFGDLSGIHQVGRTVGKDVFLTQEVSQMGFEDMMHINLTSPLFTYVSASSDETGRQAATLSWIR